MALRNKLGLTGAAFDEAEERVSKRKARLLFEDGRIDALEVGTYAALQAIRGHLRLRGCAKGRPYGGYASLYIIPFNSRFVYSVGAPLAAPGKTSEHTM